MSPLDIAVVGVSAVLVVAIYRIVVGPTSADRTVAADLLTFSVVGVLVLVGARWERVGTFDLVLVATLVAFLSAVSLARALMGGRR